MVNDKWFFVDFGGILLGFLPPKVGNIDDRNRCPCEAPLRGWRWGMDGGLGWRDREDCPSI